MMTWSDSAAFWLFNRVTHLAYLFYDRVAPELRAAQENFEQQSQVLVQEMDRQAVRMIEAGNAKSAVTRLTEFSVNRAQTLFNDWKALGDYLIVKYMDGNVKQVDENGNFLDNGSGKHIPASPLHPKFRERWLRSVAADLKK